MSDRPNLVVMEDGRVVPHDPNDTKTKPDIVFDKDGKIESVSLWLLLMTAMGMATDKRGE